MKKLLHLIILLIMTTANVFAQSAIVPVGGDAQGNGKQLQSVTVTNDLTAFQIGQYATGTYYLEVRDGKRVLKTFKIVRR